MAFLTPVNGDSQPVFSLDTRNGPQAPGTSLAGASVHPAGPKLDFFRVEANVSVNGEGGVQEYVAKVIQAVQLTSVIAMYQIDGTAMSFAVYPTGAFATAGDFLAAANVSYAGIQLDSATSVGFKLSA